MDIEDLKAMWHELKAHVDSLADERQQFLDFFENATEAYLVTDAAGTIVDANGAAVDILQRRKRYLRGKPMAVLVALDHRGEFRNRLQALAEDPSAQRSWRCVFEALELRTEVELTTRRIERAGGVGGICWRLDALQ